MPITACSTTAQGSASPAILVDFKNDCGEAVSVEGVQAVVTDKYGTVITTVTYGTYTPAVATDAWSTTIVEVTDALGVHYELTNLPTLDNGVVPGGILSVKWSMQDTGGTIEDVWSMYSFEPPAGKPAVKQIMSWYPDDRCAAYRVSWQSATDSGVLGITTLPTFIGDAASSQASTYTLPGDLGGTWYLSTPSASGVMTTTLVDATEDVDPVYLEAEDGSVWSLAVENATGDLVTTLAASAEATDTITLRGVKGVTWAVVLSSSGVPSTSAATSQTSLQDCGVSYTVDGLSSCFAADTADWSVVRKYTPKELSITTTEKDVCVMTGTVLDVSGSARPIHKVLFHVYYCDNEQVVQNTILHTGVEVDAAVDENGYFAVPLLYGALVLCEIPSANYAKRFIVPSQPQADLSQIDGLSIELRRGE